MPALQVIKGHNEGAVIPLDGDKVVMGRNPDCGVVIPAGPVSREHAQVLRVEGRYFIEDLHSRNHTFLNNQMVPPGTRTPLKHNDKIRICDFLVAFLERPPTPGDHLPAEDEEGEEASST